MDFTALHRLLGLPPGPVTDEMIDEAVTQQLAETDDLDWKGELPPAKGLNQTEFPKDIAAMANRGGGIIVYGVDEAQKAATKRVDVGDADEGYLRALRSVAVTAISPPVFGLGISKLGTDVRAVAVVVPNSVDGPHLIYRNEFFGAPIRNDADTVWMKERQIETMYRARFDERRNAAEGLTNLYDQTATAGGIESRAWLFAVARPRTPATRTARMPREQAVGILRESFGLAPIYACTKGIHPLESVDTLNPRPGLRRWVAPNTETTDRSAWKESWVSVHDDGSATLAAAVGAERTGNDEMAPAYEVSSRRIEACVGDLMALVRAASNQLGTTEYEVRIGIEWSGAEPILIATIDNSNFRYTDGSIPLARYSPVVASIQADVDNQSFIRQIYELALDCVNQGGIQNLQLIRRPDEEG